MAALAVSHLRLHLVPERELQLPAHNKGNSLRGGFGTAFRRLVCVDLAWECIDCTLRYTCPYTKVFNPFIPPDATQFTGNQNIPRPFVVKPPLTTQTEYAAGEPLVFELVVVGSAIDYLPYFIVSFRELGATGFGLNRARVQLTRVEAMGADGAATIVYEASTNVVRPAPPLVKVVGSRYGRGSRSPVAGTGEADYRLPATDYVPRATDYVELDFLTPTTLKSGSTVDRDGQIAQHPAFHHVLKRLRDRVNALATFYGNGPLDLDFKALGEAAEQVETVDDQTHWVERSRFSQRRDVQHDLSGFVGSVTFRGDLTPFLPLLRIGEFAHVGKNAVFGNGWFVVKDGAGNG
jgi:hypothetical protein